MKQQHAHGISTFLFRMFKIIASNIQKVGLKMYSMPEKEGISNSNHTQQLYI